MEEIKRRKGAWGERRKARGGGGEEDDKTRQVITEVWVVLNGSKRKEIKRLTRKGGMWEEEGESESQLG